MNIGILIPGFGANHHDWALPVYQNFVRELADSTYVRVISLRYPHTRQPYAYHNARVYPLGHGAWIRGLQRFNLWWDTYRTLQRLHQEKPFDLLHGIWADETGALSGWIAKRLNIPSVVSLAGGEIIGLSDIGYGLQRSRYGSWIVGQALRQNTRIVTPSRYVAVMPSHTYIPLGVDTEMFNLSDAPRKPNHLVHVGSLIPVKNQYLLLDTLAKLDKSITLDIIGQGDLLPSLQARAQKLGIHQRVNFLGQIPHTSLRTYYAQAQLHILTSRHEAFGMATLEAGACGTPTISTQVGLAYDEVGFVKSGDNAEDLAKIITTYLDHPEELQALQVQARQIVTQQLTIQTMAQRYITLYKSLL